jgi:adenylosuccinate synthase
MPATIILGGQWGDEGKGKLIDALACDADLVVRANGGPNAGHTVVTDQGTFKFHLIPSGILQPNCLCVIGAGVIIDVGTLLSEIDQLQRRGISAGNLRISPRAHLIMPYHPVLDALEEERRGGAKIGTTRRGAGPCYADKAARRGVRVADIIEPDGLQARLQPVVAEKNAVLTALYGHEGFDLGQLAEQFASFGEAISPYVVDTEIVVQESLDDGKRVLIEGAQAVMLDIDYGTYPYVTSSSPTAAGLCQGAGIAPNKVGEVIGVYKAYTTRVGEGAFPTELHDEIGGQIRERGAEFGTTTGRPRRTGWFDAVQARYTARLNGVTRAALTKFDILDELETIKICTGYLLDGEPVAVPPARIEDYAKVQPVYEELPGWKWDTSAARSFEDLPANAAAFVRRVEALLGCPVEYVGVGPHRQQLLGSSFALFA